MGTNWCFDAQKRGTTDTHRFAQMYTDIMNLDKHPGRTTTAQPKGIDVVAQSSPEGMY